MCLSKRAIITMARTEPVTEAAVEGEGFKWNKDGSPARPFNTSDYPTELTRLSPAQLRRTRII